MSLLNNTITITIIIIISGHFHFPEGLSKLPRGDRIGAVASWTNPDFVGMCRGYDLQTQDNINTPTPLTIHSQEFLFLWLGLLTSAHRLWSYPAFPVCGEPRRAFLFNTNTLRPVWPLIGWWWPHGFDTDIIWLIFLPLATQTKEKHRMVGLEPQDSASPSQFLHHKVKSSKKGKSIKGTKTGINEFLVA